MTLPTGLVIRPEPYDDPTAQSLVAAMIVDIEQRYAADGAAGEAVDPEAEWALGLHEVTPPLGVFLVGSPRRRGRRLRWPA